MDLYMCHYCKERMPLDVFQKHTWACMIEQEEKKKQP